MNVNPKDLLVGTVLYDVKWDRVFILLGGQANFWSDNALLTSGGDVVPWGSNEIVRLLTPVRLLPETPQ